MLGYSTIKASIDYLLSTGLVKKIYHDVVLLTKDDGKKYPVYSLGEEFVYVGVDDSKIMNCYFRVLNAATTIKSEFVGSSKKITKARVTYRVVFFNDFEERQHTTLIEKIMKLGLYENIEFGQLITDREQLIISEANRLVNFNANTFYVGIDLNVSFWTIGDDCNTPLPCGSLPNPLIGCDTIINVDTTEELDPVWNSQKNNYYTKTQIDALLAGLSLDEPNILPLTVTADNQTIFNIFNDPTGTVYYLEVNGVAYFEDEGDFSISIGINNQLIWSGPFNLETTDKLKFITI